MKTEIKKNFEEIVAKKNLSAKTCNRSADDITVIAVSKTHPFETVEAACESGVRVFGENYVQELVEKHSDAVAAGITPEWHFIGHLQSNKAKYIVEFVEIIHSVDSLKLALEINKQAFKYNKTQKIMLQVNTSGEESKSGCEPNKSIELAEQIIALPNLELQGLMTIGTFSDDEKVIRKEFRLLSSLLKDINSSLNLNLKDLSMGMSHDFDIAIEEGATFVRVGTAIFGTRDYSNR